MKKIILLFILLQVSLFANKYIGIGYGAGSLKLTDGTKVNTDMFAIYYSNTINNFIIKGNLEMVPSQTPFSKNGKVFDTVTMKGYGAGVSLAYKIYNKNEIFIAPNVSLGYASVTTTVFDTDKEITGIPLSASIIIGTDYKKDSIAYIEYGFLEADLDLDNSKESTSQLKIGVSHSINNSFSVQSLYGTNLDNEKGIDSATSFSIGVGYSF